MNRIIFPPVPTDQDLLGGKAAALMGLYASDLPIPPWFVVSPQAFYDSLTADQQADLAASDADRLRALLDRVVPSSAIVEQIERALPVLCPEGAYVAVRSSAVDEDGADHSFAGQLDSFLFVSPEQVAEKVAAVWRSGFSERILAYRKEQGLAPLPSPPAVLVQRMITADAAGVAFSADPITGQRGVTVVSGVFGLGTSLVSGECDADTWRIDRSGTIIERTIARKDTAHRAAPGNGEGVASHAIAPGQTNAPCLSDEQVQEIAALARKTAAHFGRPQDIEWAVAEGRIFLLQSRPITSLSALSDPDGCLNIWDNSNIAESYGGVTTPLTFSFARHIYEEVYRQFCRIMAVPPAAIAANEQIFPRMLGLVRGRVYYNLLNWYRLLALLPGFTINRRFMELMMGVKEGIPEEVLTETVANYRVSPLKDLLNLGWSIGGLIKNQLQITASIRRFHARLDVALAPPSPPLETLRPDELMAQYRMLEAQLLTRWDAPLVNDFFAMIFYGLLRKLAASWCADTNETLQNDLITGEGGIISAEPAKRVREMAEIAARDEVLADLLATADRATIDRAVSSLPALGPLMAQYLEKFGDRCLDELKLESATLHDEPLPLYRSVGQFARRLRSGAAMQPLDEGAIRANAEQRVKAALAGKPLKQSIFFWVLAQARGRVRDRENLRFERTRLFGRVRRIFLEIGKRFQANGILDHSRDIFWLEKDEIFGFIDGTSSTTNLRGLAELRRTEFTAWQESEPPADRFETQGMVNHGQAYRSIVTTTAAPTGTTLKGIGCCPGIVRGRVRVTTDPRQATIQQGEILVAERTDPGWIMLFPSCAALLVERGSLLSHSAIVAREMGIPAIVSLPGLTGWLATGDLVEMDGASGIVRKIEEQAHVK